jgi:hypothetical protein
MSVCEPMRAPSQEQIENEDDEIEKQNRQNSVGTLGEGDLVRSNREFAGVPKGSTGKVIRIERPGVSKQRSENSYGIEWQDLPEYTEDRLGKKLVDWFAEDESQFLDKVTSRGKRTYNEILWIELIENGRTKEKGLTNRLSDADIVTIRDTLDYFGVRATGQVVFDLHTAKYKVYDALGMWLQSGLRDAGAEAPEDDRNVLVALANVYIHTAYVTQFVDYLRYMDLELDQGRWNSPEFIKKIQQWNADDLKLMKAERRG